jgi:tetratricopeptide (TPR) repeat protein
MRSAWFLTIVFSAATQAQDPAVAPLPPDPPMAQAAQMAQLAQPPAPAQLAQPAQPAPPAPPARAARIRMRDDNEESSYRSGTRAIDRREYDHAVEAFGHVIESKSGRADGALYWKAYALNKLGRRDEAIAALAQLQKEYPQSRWLNDAKALDVEVRQASGKPVSPDAESDEDLKLLAINGLVSSDPERGVPLLQKVLADPKASPRVKERALFVVAQSRDPRARDILAQIAKGGGNPDMQLKAVEYLGMFSKGNTQALADIYSATTDAAVKRAVIRGLMMAGDTDRMVNLAKTEKSPELRKEAIRTLGMMRRDKGGEELVSMYASETDKSVKQAIVEGLFMQQNAKAMVDIARKESDMTLKKELVQRLAMMRSKEATDYMMEVLNK